MSEMPSMPVPKTIEQCEPGGVSWMTRIPSVGLTSTSSLNPAFSTYQALARSTSETGTGTSSRYISGWVVVMTVSLQMPLPAG